MRQDNNHNESWVKIRELTYTRGNKIIFENISLDIPRGKITAVMGPSGSGKTTLLRLIGGQLRPKMGTVEINGQNIHQLSRKALYQARRYMGILFQANALFTNLSVFDNIAFPLREHTRLSDALIRDIVLMKLQAVGLRGASQLRPSQLSGGMARRVALARSVVMDPELMMYDEPFTGQDPISMGVLVKLVKELNQALSMTSIIVSHDVPETVGIADYIYLISGGKVVGQGSPETIYQESNPYLQQFMQGLPDGAVPFHHPAKDYAAEILDEEAV